jgi:type I restriction enzyme R subunit
MLTETKRTTRKKQLDLRLIRAGWSVAPHRPNGAYASTAVEELPTANGQADYALYDDGRVHGVVEAKKGPRGPQGVLTQAERYSKGIDQVPRYQGEFSVPFLDSTNGEVVWLSDARNELSRSSHVAEFHTPEHQRKMLVTMATGTGKTLTKANEVYRLIKSGVARRVLFLIDRRALAVQAIRAFASIEAEPGLKFDKIYPVYSQRFQQSDLDEGSTWDRNVMPNKLLTAPKRGDAFVCVGTIQRMGINLFGGEAALQIGDEHDGFESYRETTFQFTKAEEPNPFRCFGTFAEFIGGGQFFNPSSCDAFVFEQENRHFVLTYGRTQFYLRPFSNYDLGIEVAKRVANKNDVNQKTSAAASPGALAKPPATACGGLRPNLKTGSWSQ